MQEEAEDAQLSQTFSLLACGLSTQAGAMAALRPRRASELVRVEAFGSFLT
jgi:hypothetical protein